MFSLNIEQSKALEVGIDVHKLPAGTTVLVITKNNLYKLVKAAERKHVIAQGGKYLLEPTEVVFTGSTFGGSMLKIGWIGYGMLMEMFLLDQNKRIKTSPVNAARVIGDGWEYDLDWANMGTAKVIRET
jgi:hypothetical protein